MPSLPPGIVINSPQNVEHVLKNNDIFVKGDFFKLRSWDLFGNLQALSRSTFAETMLIMKNPKAMASLMPTATCGESRGKLAYDSSAVLSSNRS